MESSNMSLIKKPSGWRGGRFIPGRYFSSIKYNAARRRLEFSLTLEYLDALWEKQNGRCAYSNRQLEIPTKSNKGTASIDRIDSEVGYIEGNVQFVHKSINTMKWNMGEAEFLQTIEEIYNYKKV